MSESSANSKLFKSFAAIRKESAFFLPFFPESDTLSISMKHVMYLGVGVIGVISLVVMGMISQFWTVLIPFFIFMGIYKKNKVHPEYVLIYLIKHLFAKKEEKERKVGAKKTRSRPTYGCATYGQTEETAEKEQITAKENMQTIKIAEKDIIQEITLNIGIANSLVLVDVYIRKKRLTTHNAVEADGTMVVSLVPTIGEHEVKVVKAGTDEIVATEKIKFVETRQ